MEKSSSTKPIPGAKKVGDAVLEGIGTVGFHWLFATKIYSQFYWLTLSLSPLHPPYPITIPHLPTVLI